MKRILIITALLLLIGCAYAQNSTIVINNVEFEIPDKYQGGELNNGKYQLDNVFSIRCIDDNPMKVIGLWAEESNYSKDLTIGNHPVRHYHQFNQYVKGNHSHAYFASGHSAYEISWLGTEIEPDIENLIKNTPDSEIDDDDFYNALDDSVSLYKQQKINKLNKDSEHNLLETKYQSQQTTKDDTRFKEILLTYYLNK